MFSSSCFFRVLQVEEVREEVLPSPVHEAHGRRPRSLGPATVRGPRRQHAGTAT